MFKKIRKIFKFYRALPEIIKGITDRIESLTSMSSEMRHSLADMKTSLVDMGAAVNGNIAARLELLASASSEMRHSLADVNTSLTDMGAAVNGDIAARLDLLVSTSSEMRHSFSGVKSSLTNLGVTVNNNTDKRYRALVDSMGKTVLPPLSSSPFTPSHLVTLRAFKEAMERADFAERFFALTKGLDEKSMAVVTGILARLQQSLEEKPPFNIFTTEERLLFATLHDEVFSKIVKLADGAYAFKQYLLPRNAFDIGVFHFRYGLEYVKNISATAEKDIIDAGSFIGDSLLLLAPYTRKKIYSFEACLENYQDMLKTIEMNHIENAHPEHLALADKPGTI